MCWVSIFAFFVSIFILCLFQGLLFPVVRRFLAVPASNADIERFFSLCKNVYDKQRSVMAEATLEKLMMLSYNGEALGLRGATASPDSDDDADFVDKQVSFG